MARWTKRSFQAAGVALLAFLVAALAVLTQSGRWAGPFARLFLFGFPVSVVAALVGASLAIVGFSRREPPRAAGLAGLLNAAMLSIPWLALWLSGFPGSG